MTAVRSTGARVEELLDGLRTGRLSGSLPGGGPAAARAAEELVRLLVGLYGGGLAAIVAQLHAEGEAGAGILARLAENPQVEGLLLIHDLHPLDAAARIQRALDRVRPYLGSHAGGVRFLGVTDGVARLVLEGSCHGCPSSAVTVELALRTAIEDAAPEVSDVQVEGMAVPPAGPGPLLQIGRRPPDALPQPGTASAPGAPDGTWLTLPDIGPPSSRPVSTSAGGTAVVLCAVRGTLYAYLDACAACGSSLAAGALTCEELTCPACAAVYNVRLAGAGVTDPARHLSPLPLLSGSQGVRVALPGMPAGGAVPAQPAGPAGAGRPRPESAVR